MYCLLFGASFPKSCLYLGTVYSVYSTTYVLDLVLPKYKHDFGNKAPNKRQYQKVWGGVGEVINKEKSYKTWLKLYLQLHLHSNLETHLEPRLHLHLEMHLELRLKPRLEPRNEN